MVRRFAWVALTTALVCATSERVQAQIIGFDNIVNPPTTGNTLSPTAQAIVNDQRLAQHEVALAIFYLKHNRSSILAGNDALYNSIFGQFYVPNNPFTGLYNQTTKFGNYQAQIDPLNPNHRILVPIPGPEHSNPAQFSDVLTTFEHIQKSMTHPTFYQWGPDFGTNVTSDIKQLNTFGGQPVLTGDLKFGTGAFITVGGDRGTLEWGFSTSISDLNTAALKAGKLLPWYQDEGVPPTEKTEPFAFTHVFMTIYGQDWSAKGNTVPGFNIETIGQSFVTQQQQTSSGFGLFNPPTFAPTQFNQLDMIIQSFAQQIPTNLLSGTGLGVSGLTAYQPAIYAGFVDAVGTNSPDFAQTFDSGSYAEFADLVGTSNLDVNSLPPLGKSGSFLGDFSAQPNAGFQSFLPVIGP